MKKILTVMPLLAALLGCAETRVEQEENLVTQKITLTSGHNLKSQAAYSRQLSAAYKSAALKASKDQDAAAFVTFVSALSVVAGGLGSASNTALANRAAVGSTTSWIATRTLSKETIKGVFTGAKRMNCVATTAEMGRFMLAETGTNTKAAARAATYGAISEIKIIVREALVRDVADYATIKNDLTAEIKKSDNKARLNRLDGSEKDVKSFDLGALNQYLSILDNCLLDASQVSAVGVIINQ